MKNGKQETWTVLAIRFAKMTNEYYRQLHRLKVKEREIADEIKELGNTVASESSQLKKLQRERVGLQKYSRVSKGKI